MDQHDVAPPGQIVRRGPTLVAGLAQLDGARTGVGAEVDQLLAADGADPAVTVQPEHAGQSPDSPAGRSSQAAVSGP